MNERTILFTTVLLALATAASAAPVDPALEAAMVAVGAAREAKDEGALVEAVRTLRDVRNPKADPILQRIAARDLSDRAAIAAVRALGDRGGPRNATFLGGLTKTHRRRPEVRRAVLRALGDTGEPSAIDAIARAVSGDPRKDPDTVAAGVEGLGGFHTKRAVAKLVGIQASLEPIKQWERDHGADPPPDVDADTWRRIIDLDLRVEAAMLRLTGQRRGGRRLLPIHLSRNRDRVARLPRHGVEITRPSDKWRYQVAAERGFELTAVREHEGQRAAWVSVHVHSVLHVEPATIEALLAMRKTAIEKGLAEIVEATWNDAGSVAGRDARVHRVAGLLGENPVRVTEFVLEVGHRLHVIRQVVVDGVPSGIGVEAGMFLNGFRLAR